MSLYGWEIKSDGLNAGLDTNQISTWAVFSKADVSLKLYGIVFEDNQTYDEGPMFLNLLSYNGNHIYVENCTFITNVRVFSLLAPIDFTLNSSEIRMFSADYCITQCVK